MRSFFLYCEEVEWFLRAKRRGLTLGYANNALVRHEQGTTTGASPIMSKKSKLSVYLNERNKILLMREDSGKLPLCPFIMMALIFTLKCVKRYGLEATRIWLRGDL